MTGSFDDFMDTVRAEAEAQGVDAVEELAALDQLFSIGAQIVKRRVELGLTQEDLAERSGIAQPKISKIERGEQNPTEATLAKIGSALDGRLQFAWR